MSMKAMSKGVSMTEAWVSSVAMIWEGVRSWSEGMHRGDWVERVRQSEKRGRERLK